MKNHFFKLMLLFMCTSAAKAQETEDLLSLVDKEKPKKEYVKYAFKSLLTVTLWSFCHRAPWTSAFFIALAK
jgi:hypothetical protein